MLCVAGTWKRHLMPVRISRSLSGGGDYSDWGTHILLSSSPSEWHPSMQC